MESSASNLQEASVLVGSPEPPNCQKCSLVQNENPPDRAYRIRQIEPRRVLGICPSPDSTQGSRASHQLKREASEPPNCQKRSLVQNRNRNRQQHQKSAQLLSSELAGAESSMAVDYLKLLLKITHYSRF